ncbi:kinetochore Spc25 family protein [Polynucleobacter sp. IMCC 30228]|uniref:kinetochore Spc25 family protein n=1 Tax=Polynucleobacter sp. IMCC 30228 TaxID=2781011 RepID=UPI001F4450D2|nr:kinetochore Spc25 family protein [Polynucleobacter sp. IMCC 30228]MCE7528250.1 kinetochore Spc25 family protein [Polynucleobacter sp. IMCC 30228]
MTIKQFNASFLVQEDRLLFRFNTIDDAEYRFWFTRRVTLFILGATAHLLTKHLEKTHSPETAAAITEFQKEALKEQVSKQASKQGEANGGQGGQVGAEAYQAASNYPIGADPLLVMDVKCELSKDGEADVLSMDFVLPGGANLNLKLGGPTLQAMCLLLDQLRESAGWGAPFVIGEMPAQPSDELNVTPNEITNKPKLH